MQVCVIYAGKTREDNHLKEIASSFAKGLESQGHNVDIINMYTDTDKKLTFYDYIVLGTSSKTGFGGNIPDVVCAYLHRSGQLSGKRSFAFVSNGGIRKQKTLSVLMKAMEGEGMYLKSQDVIKNKDVALAIGKRLNVERNL